MTTENEYGQLIGDAAPDWHPAELPTATTLHGRFCTLERLNPEKHTADLYSAYAAAEDGRNWTYMAPEPFTSEADYRAWAEEAASTDDPRHYAVIDNTTNTAVGTLSLMRHDPANGVIEVGYVTFSPAMQRTPLSTEAQYLLMRYVFDELGYRRYEWKCDSLNEPSRRTAARLGFTYEGTFRQNVVYKNRNRDTAWFSIIDSEWPAIRTAFETWLDPANFDDTGQQKQPLNARRTA